MKKILKMGTVGFIYFATATLIAQALIFSYTWFSWGMTWQRGHDAIAVARGRATIEPMPLENPEDNLAAEQPSFEEVLRIRALKVRDFELRGEALNQGKTILRQQQDTYVKNLDALNVAKTGFERQVADYEEKSRAEGLEENVVILQNLKPDLAKVQFLKMYEDREMEALIDITRTMETKNLAKILNLFTTSEDDKRVAEILRRIRDGFEFQPPIDTTLNHLPPQR